MTKRGALAFILCISILSPAQDTHDRAVYLLRENGVTPAVKFVEENSEKSLYGFGRELLYLGRTDEALEWFATLTKEYNDPQYFYGKAWTHWVRLEVGQARHDAELIVGSDAPELIKARAHYLLGLISYQKNEMTVSAHHAHECERLYGRLGKNGGLYLANMLHASIAIWQKQYDAGEQYIERALTYNQKLSLSYGMGKIHELRAEIYWQKKDYTEAMYYARLSRDAYFEENNDASGWHLKARIGLLHAFAGEFEEAYTIAKEISAIGKGKKNDRLIMYNHITWIYMDNCKGYDSTPRKNEIARWVGFQKDDSELLELLEYIETVDCP